MSKKDEYVYSIKDSFYEKVNRDPLVNNHECVNDRPHYFCVQDPELKLFWMIPLSTKVDKYKLIYDREVETKGACTKIVLGRFAGKNAAFLLQDMFPINPAYLHNVYTLKNNPVPVHTTIQKLIHTNFHLIMNMDRNGADLLFPDVSRIKALMLEEIKRVRVMPSISKKEEEYER